MERKRPLHRTIFRAGYTGNRRCLYRWDLSRLGNGRNTPRWGPFYGTTGSGCCANSHACTFRRSPTERMQGYRCGCAARPEVHLEAHPGAPHTRHGRRCSPLSRIHPVAPRASGPELARLGSIPDIHAPVGQCETSGRNNPRLRRTGPTVNASTYVLVYWVVTGISPLQRPTENRAFY